MTHGTLLKIYMNCTDISESGVIECVTVPKFVVEKCHLAGNPAKKMTVRFAQKMETVCFSETASTYSGRNITSSLDVTNTHVGGRGNREAKAHTER
jgi:hypothetical protein